MLTIDQIFKIEKFRQSYPNEGSCFGVTNSSRLRRNNEHITNIKSEDISEYKKGKKYIELYSY